jgi:hypothetical protein
MERSDARANQREGRSIVMDESLSKVIVSVVTVLLTTLVFNLVFDRTFKKQKEMLRYLNPFTPRRGIDPAMAATLNPVSRILMSRSRLSKDVLALSSAGMGELWRDEHIRANAANGLRLLGVMDLFWTKQSLLIAAERDALEGTRFSIDIAMRIFLRKNGDHALIAANVRSMPARATSDTIVAVAKNLPAKSYVAHLPIPHLDAHTEAMNYSHIEGYEAGERGYLAAIIQQHPENPIDVVKFCMERGIDNFTGESFIKYCSMGAVREGML